MRAGKRTKDHAWAVTAGKRTPVDWRRYAAYVRRAQRELPRTERPIGPTLVASAVFALAGALLLQTVGTGVAAGIAQIGTSVVNAIPSPTQEPIVIGETPVTVSAAPVLEGLPEFTRSPQLAVAGRVPGFGLKPGREVRLLIGTAVAATPQLYADGRFGPVTLTLPDGPSTISAVLVEGDREIARSSANVVVDRTPPELTISSPRTGAEVVGPEVTIEGMTEAGAEVTINTDTIRPNVDGRFSDRLTATPGPFRIAVVSKDRAGNETKALVEVVVTSATPAPVGGTVLNVSLDRTRVRPGETVVATVVATLDGAPKGGLPLTIQVGVVTVGTARTDASGVARLGFAAPSHEVADVSVVAIGGGASARASLTVTAK